MEKAPLKKREVTKPAEPEITNPAEPEITNPAEPEITNPTEPEIRDIRVKPVYVSKPQLRKKSAEISTRGGEVWIEEPKPEPVFGSYGRGNKRLDVDGLLAAVNRKGQFSFERPMKELFFEVPPGFENGVMLTHNQICRMFGVTPATVHEWRKRFALPVVVLGGGRKPPVRYDEGVVLEWARLHGKKVMNHDYLQWV